ncbi:MAG TPA: Ger(x)C family spore germination protein, partial [Sporolactobacillaceae bacterium]|nr:Ger(x)C family spore germination protein [Sporolactobacillaceae bacterium]
MKGRRLILKGIVAFFLLSVLSGCWDYRRLDQTAMVMGIAVDPAPGEKGYQVTFQLPSMPGVLSGAGAGGAGGGQSPPAPTMNIVVTALSLGNAVSDAQEHLDRTLFFGNLQTIVMNEKLKKEEFQECLTELLENSRIPNTASLFISRGSAKGIFESKEIQDEPVAIFLRNSVRDVKSRGFEQPIPLWVFFRNIYGFGINPVVPRVYSNSQGKIIFEGLGIFKGYQWERDLTLKQARGYNWVSGNVEKMQLMIQNGDKPIVIEVSHDKAKMRWKKINGRYHLYADINAEALLVQEPSMGEATVNKKAFNNIQRRASEEIKQEILST